MINYPSTFYGAMGIHYFDTKFGHLYIVSENHVNQNKTPCNLEEFVAIWKKEHPDLQIWSEMNEFERLLWKSKATNATTPLLASANIDDIATINIRRSYPFHIIESVLAYDYFVAINAPAFFDKEARTRIYETTKQFEKRMFEQIDSRKGLIEFVLSLVDPKKGMMKWYMEQLDAFAKVGIRMNSLHTNPIYDIMTEVPAPFYNKIIEWVQLHVATLCDHEEYSIAAKSMKSTRRTNSRIVFDKYEELKDIFIGVFAILMDVYIILLMHKKQPKHLLLILGLEHSLSIFDFLLRKDMIRFDKKNWIMFSNHADYVHTADRMDLQRIVVPRKPIEDFQMFRRKRKIAQIQKYAESKW